MEIFHVIAASGGLVSDITATGEDLITKFGIHTEILVSQIVGFLIFAAVLKIFAFGPIQQMLDQRRERIAAGEKKLKRIETQLAESEATTAATIAKANAEAKRLIEEAKEGAESLSEQKAQEATAKAQQILAKAEAESKAERQRISAELKSEFGRLVASTTSQVTGKVLTEDDKSRINDEALAKVAN